MANHIRVIPRDLFNEAKLLKCMGQLSLHIHDGNLPGLIMSHEEGGPAFDIQQDFADGSIYIANTLVVHEHSGMAIDVATPLNSNRPYPLLAVVWGIDVFNDDGTVTDEFKDQIDRL